jgi:hypothetical protein
MPSKHGELSKVASKLTDRLRVPNRKKDHLPPIELSFHQIIDFTKSSKDRYQPTSILMGMAQVRTLKPVPDMCSEKRRLSVPLTDIVPGQPPLLHGHRRWDPDL